MSFQERVAFIWVLADLLRGDYKDAEYAKIILPFTVLRRLDCALGARSLDQLKDGVVDGFDSAAKDVMECFELREQIPRLRESRLLGLLIERFSQVDLHPAIVPNHEMGSIFEELIRRFSEQSGASGGEHFTPREVIRLMVDLLFHDEPAGAGIRTLYDPACGTGGMLSVAEDYLRELNSGGRLEVFGQELNRESYAICKADLLMRGGDPSHVHLGNTFLRDELDGQRFDYMLSNPPFGVEWKKAENAIRDEHQRLGFAGRFGAGLPRVNDGSLLFLQHMLSKMKPEGSRLAVVFNGSPLFAGDAGSGESDIRRWILEKDWLEAIVALPDQLFYNTGLSTYIWVLTNRKIAARKDKVQLIDATGFSRKMRRSLGAKRNEIAPEQIRQIACIHAEFHEGPLSRIVNKEDFLYRRIIVERPLRLNFQASPERLGSLDPATAAILAGMDAALYRDQSAFEQALAVRFRETGVKLGRVLKNRILHALGERDPEAAVSAGLAASPNPIPSCAIPKTCRGAKTSRRGSSERCCRMRPTPGSTTPEPEPAARSRSRAFSTSRSRCARWPKSTRKSKSSIAKSNACWNACGSSSAVSRCARALALDAAQAYRHRLPKRALGRRASGQRRRPDLRPRRRYRPREAARHVGRPDLARDSGRRVPRTPAPARRLAARKIRRRRIAAGGRGRVVRSSRGRSLLQFLGADAGRHGLRPGVPLLPACRPVPLRRQYALHQTKHRDSKPGFRFVPCRNCAHSAARRTARTGALAGSPKPRRCPPWWRNIKI